MIPIYRISILLVSISCALFACVQESEAPSEQDSRGPGQTTGEEQGGGGDGLFDDGDGSSSGGGFGTDSDDTSSGGGSGSNSSEGGGGPPVPNGDPSQVKYIGGSIGAYLSPIQNVPKGAVDFRCPGDSFLVGEKSTWDQEEKSKDRIYQYRCQFIADGQGVPIRKSNCELSDPITDNVLEYSCPNGKYLAGQVSTFDDQKKDREYKYECCEARSRQSGKQLVHNIETLETGEPLEMCTTDEVRIPELLKPIPDYSKLVNAQVNDRMGDLDYNCTDAALLPLGGLEVNFQIVPIPDAILSRVKSTFYPEAQDRRHSFYCCQLKVGSGDSE